MLIVLYPSTEKSVLEFSIFWGFFKASIWRQLKFSFYFQKEKLSILCQLWQYFFFFMYVFFPLKNFFYSLLPLGIPQWIFIFTLPTWKFRLNPILSEKNWGGTLLEGQTENWEVLEAKGFWKSWTAAEMLDLSLPFH